MSAQDDRLDILALYGQRFTEIRRHLQALARPEHTLICVSQAGRARELQNLLLFQTVRKLIPSLSDHSKHVTTTGRRRLQQTTPFAHYSALRH